MVFAGRNWCISVGRLRLTSLNDFSRLCGIGAITSFLASGPAVIMPRVQEPYKGGVAVVDSKLAVFVLEVVLPEVGLFSKKGWSVGGGK